MTPQPSATAPDLLTHIIANVAAALAAHAGGTQEQQTLLYRSAFLMIEAFQPEDAIEAMLASHCVMFHTLMVDSLLDTPPAEAGPPKRRPHGNLTTLSSGFRGNLAELRRHRRPGANDQPDEAAPPAAARETEVPRAAAQPMNRAARRQAVRAQKHAASRPRLMPAQTASLRTGPDPASLARTPPVHRATPEQVAACLANPEAAAALQAGDAAGFARAMGIAQPNAAYLAAAAAPGSPFQRPA